MPQPLDGVPIHLAAPATISASQWSAFQTYCEEQTGQHFADPHAFYAFTVAEYPRFWSLFLAWSGVLHEGATEPVCTDSSCEHAVFFPGVRLGYVENLLRLDGPFGGDRPALTACDSTGRRELMTRRQLAEQVGALARHLEMLGVKQGDRVVAIAHNDAQAIVGGLAVAALGASLSTVSPEMGAFSIAARFAPLKPAVVMCHLRDLSSEASPTFSERLPEILHGIPTLRTVLALDDGPAPSNLPLPFDRLSQVLATPHSPFVWRRFPFNQPLFTLFSSGTTGQPKCIMHGAGGVLLEHLKEHRLHGDLRPTDKLFFQTSCSWMMWNWQLSALAVGAELVLYAGAVKGPQTLWDLVEKEGVTVFGTSPAYLSLCQEAGYSPRGAHKLDSLRAVLSTGSILYDSQFDWVRAHVGELPLQSISGGTDIVGCFVLGNPNLPVYRGESQCRSLGMDVQAFGASESTGIGELVCRNPFPSRPLGFYGDDQGQRFHDSYFKQHEGVWTHGDLIEITPRQTVRMHGRSDGILNVNGIRIGPAELYQILQSIPELSESLAVEQRLSSHSQSRLVLLVVLKSGATLDGALRRRIRKELLTRGSAAHVPALILAVSALPTTHSGKRSERAARDVLSGVEAVNATALKNPESLDELVRALAREESRLAPKMPRANAAQGAPLEASLTAIWERLLDVGPIELDDNFFELGGTSMMALRLFNSLREETGWDLPVSMLFDVPTVGRLAAALRDSVVAPFSPLVPLKTSGSGRPLFLIHGLAGDLLELRGLAQQMGGERPVLGLRARGLDPREKPDKTVEEMAEYYLDHVRRHQPVGPYALAGYSFGGLVAFEMARRLLKARQEVAFLGLIDTDLHDACLRPFDRAKFRALRMLHRGTQRLLRLVPRLLSVCTPIQNFVERQLHATTGKPSVAPWLTEQMTPQMRKLEQLAWRAFYAYRPKAHAGAITFFQAMIRPPDFCYPVPLWQAVCKGGVSISAAPGNHFTMIREPHVGTLARKVCEHLDAP